MNKDIEQQIDAVWSASLEKMIKKDLTSIRPSLGDYVDLYVPQIRTLLLMEANPAAAKSIYDSAHASANRNTYYIMKKLGMPADYFWKFEYWPKDRARETLRKVINKVFSSMMNRTKEGGLELESVEIEPVRITIAFSDCVECASMVADKPVCFYHTATFAGILTSLLNRGMSAYESQCRATGGSSCVIIIGNKEDTEIAAEMSRYLAPIKLSTSVDERLNLCLKGNQSRTMGNLVDIGYYDLMLLSSILAEPELANVSDFKLGVEHGTKIAPLLKTFYQNESLEVLQKYFGQIQHLIVKSIDQTENEINLTLQECAEVNSTLRRQELLNFLFGEAQGLISILAKKQVAFKDSEFNSDSLKIRFSVTGLS